MVVTALLGALLFLTMAFLGLVLLIAGIFLRRNPQRRVTGNIMMVVAGLLGTPFVACSAFIGVGNYFNNAHHREEIGPFFSAIEDDDLREVKRFVQAGEDVNKENPSAGKRTPLVFAAGMDRPDIVDYLIFRDADMNLPCGYSKERYPILTAVGPWDKTISNGNIHTIRVLLQHGVDLTPPGDRKVLHLEVLYNPNPDVIGLLVKYGADLNATDEYGYTPLMTATTMSDEVPAWVNWLAGLLDVNPDVNQKHLRHASALIGLGANVNARCNRGETALDKALQQGFTEMVSLLKRHGAKTSGQLNKRSGCKGEACLAHDME